MVKKIAFTALCLLSLLSSTSFSANAPEIKSAVSIQYDLKPNESQIFSNFLFWELTGTCSILSPVHDNPLFFTVLAKNGSINGVKYSKGESLDFIAKVGEVFEISAEPNAQVELKNTGNVAVKITCNS